VDDFLAGALEYARLWSILRPTYGQKWKTAWERFYVTPRESIDHVANIVSMIEAEVSNELCELEAVGQNQSFKQYIAAHNLINHAKRIAVSVLPSGDDLELQNVLTFEPAKPKLFYAGREPIILKRFGTEQTNLLQISQNNPRRRLQQQYVQEILKIPEVPERPIVDRIRAFASRRSTKRWRAARRAENIQHRSGRAVHQRRLHR
jgi:hypothetical protein